MYLWYYSTRAFARSSFHADCPEVHGACQICIQSYNIYNVFLHFIISQRIHAAFCTVIVFVSAALYSEASGLQPTKYAVRPEFLQFPGLTAYFLLPVPKSHGFIPLFLSLVNPCLQQNNRQKTILHTVHASSFDLFSSCHF